MTSLSADEAIATRRSVRAFLPTPVDLATVDELLALASRAPSGTNIQPWKVRVVAGEARERLCAAILEALDRDGQAAHQREWNYYPVNWREPFLARRRKIGWDLYGLLGIRKGDFEGTERQRRRNFEFFGAPSVSSSRSTRISRSAAGSTSASSSARSPSPRAAAGSTPARRPPSPISTR